MTRERVPGLKSLVDAGIGAIDAAELNTMVLGADDERRDRRGEARPLSGPT